MKLRLFPQKQAPRYTSQLAAYRKEANLSVEELARYCEVTEETIEQVEAGTYEPSVILAEHLARRLGQPVEQIFIAHTPAPLERPMWEERVRSQSHRYGYIIALILIFGSLFAANICLLVGADRGVTFSVEMFFIIGLILLVSVGVAVKGSWRLQIQLNRRIPQQKRILWTAFRALLFGAMMTWIPYPGTSTHHSLLYFFSISVTFGLMTYWSTYRMRSDDK